MNDATATIGPACLSVAIVMIFACNGGVAEWRGTVETLPGGGVLVHNPAEGLWGDTETWTLEPELRIGRVDGHGPDLFGRVSGLAVDARDRVWILEGQAKDLRIFDREGRHVRTIGRAGGGPGEFAQPWGVVLDRHGHAWVPDGGNARYTRFDTAGALVEERPREVRMFGPFAGGVLADGRFVDMDVAAGDPPESPLMAMAGLGRNAPILRTVFMIDSMAAAVDETFRIPLATRSIEPFSVRHSRGGTMVLGVPFAPRVIWRFDPDGAVWWGESHEYRLVRQTLAGDTTMIIEREHVPIPVTGEDIEAWDSMQTRFREAGGRIDHSRIPSAKPVFEHLLVDDAGYLWVDVVHDGEGRRYDVFDAEGRYLGRVSAPDGLQTFPWPIIRGDRMYAVVRDSLDVPFVTRLRIAGRD